MHSVALLFRFTRSAGIQYAQVARKFKRFAVDRMETAALAGIVLWKECKLKNNLAMVAVQNILPSETASTMQERIMEELRHYAAEKYPDQPVRAASVVCLLRDIEVSAGFGASLSNPYLAAKLLLCNLLGAGTQPAPGALHAVAGQRAARRAAARDSRQFSGLIPWIAVSLVLKNRISLIQFPVY